MILYSRAGWRISK